MHLVVLCAEGESQVKHPRTNGLQQEAQALSRKSHHVDSKKHVFIQATYTAFIGAQNYTHKNRLIVSSSTSQLSFCSQYVLHSCTT